MMLIADVKTFCTDTSAIWQFVGYIVMIFKIVIPLLLIVFGMVDLGKAVVANDDKAIKSATTTLVKRAGAAIVIFFIPTIVGFIFSIITGFANAKNATDYDTCKSCLLSPTKCNAKWD